MMRISALLLAVSILCSGCGVKHRYMLTDQKFAPTASNEEIKLFVNEVKRPHIEIAYVQSTPNREKDTMTRRQQLEELQVEARKVGADAVMGVRQLNNQVRGAVIDEAVPFRSYRQGQYKLYFLRGTAIKFVTEAEAAAADTTPSGDAQPTAATTEGGAIPEVLTVDVEKDLPVRTSPKGMSQYHDLVP
ncbi:hypothetical protein BH09SUM1_BH09SUM1_19180 [soil metagenome]